MATKKVTPAAAKETVKKTTEKPAAAKTAKTTKTTAAKPAITEEDIRKKAEEIYQARVAAGTEGTPEGDWIAAEKALNVGRKK
jgi:hypothetical protein